jgi:SAM-dependent methyltransferase
MRLEFYSTYFALEEEHWWFVGRRRIFTELLEKWLAADRPLQVLDFGCGTGAMLSRLDRFGTVTAVDAEAEAVRFCRQRGRERVLHVPAGAALPFEDDSFDLVTALDVIEHIEDDATALSELLRVLRYSGSALITVPAYNFLWGDQDEISHHYRRFTAKSLRETLERAGFTIEHLSYFNTFLFLPIAAARLTRRLRRPPRGDRTDFTLAEERTNRLLTHVFGAESRLVKRYRLPFGVSLLALARPG